MLRSLVKDLETTSVRPSFVKGRRLIAESLAYDFAQSNNINRLKLHINVFTVQ